MPVVICMLRGVNVGGHNKIKMDALRALCQSLKLRDAQTYVQSGNVVFKTDESDLGRLGQRLEDAIQKKFGFRPDVVLRTAPELRTVIAKNPFAKRRGIEPNKLLVLFLVDDPGGTAQEIVDNKTKAGPEEVRLGRREIYIYFPNGIGQSKLPWATLGKALNTTGTGRNWNSITKLLQMAEVLEAGG